MENQISTTNIDPANGGQISAQPVSRKQLLTSVAFGAMLAILSSIFGCSSTSSGAAAPQSQVAPKDGTKAAAQSTQAKPTAVINPLKAPTEGSIPVAFLISEGVDLIDFTGPWEVFHQASVPVSFKLYSVGESMKPVNVMGGGMKLTPDYTFANAPIPKIVVIPAQRGSEAMLNYIRKTTKVTDVTMSVCTGSDLLARAGLLSGKAATTHHGAYRELAVAFPDIQVKRGVRFVEVGNIATSAGLSSGIDLALRVVERYFGRDAARSTAYQLEYQGEGWMNPDSNQIYAEVKDSTEDHPLCPVCEMAVDPATSPKSVYKGKTYYFMAEQHKKTFQASPEKFIKAAAEKK